MIKYDVTAAELLAGGKFGIERENLRITENGRLSLSEDPFGDGEYITRDFSENQTELNTPPCGSVKEVYDMLVSLTGRMNRVLSSLETPEYLWPFSNPPYMGSTDEIMPARFTGAKSGETAYREYLAGKYGKYRMAYSGIHVNFSLDEDLVSYIYAKHGSGTERDYKDRLYLDMAAMCSVCGWLVMLMTAASPVADSLFIRAAGAGEGAFSGRSSMRCSDVGYWNSFDPVISYPDMKSYAGSLKKYTENGSIYRLSELYIPVRIKPSGNYSPENLEASGAHHLEYRMVDLNPFEACGIAYEDLEFMHLFFVWCCFQQKYECSAKALRHAVDNYRNAAVYDSGGSSIVMPDGTETDLISAGNGIFDQLESFYYGIAAAGRVISSVRTRFDCPEKRYASRVLQMYGENYCCAGTELAGRYSREIR